MKSYSVPGLSIAVIDQGKIDWAKGYGQRTLEGRDLVTPATLFQVASISKPITAFGVLRLVDRGLISLDEPVNSVLKTWKIPENNFTLKTPITLRHLLTHSSGANVSGFPGYKFNEPLPTTIQILKGQKPANTEGLRICSTPGAEHSYSGAGFIVIQLLLEELSGLSFSEYMRTQVLEPLGMSESYFSQPLSAGLQVDVASGHTAKEAMVPGRWHTYPELAAAGLWSTPSDLCRFSLGLQNAANGVPGALLSVATARSMLTPGVEDWGLGIGLGGSLEGGDGFFSHGGGNEGYICMLFGFMTQGRGAAITTNADTGNEIVMEILRAISSVYGWSILAPRPVELAACPPETLADYCGTYQSIDDPDMMLKIDMKATKLIMRSRHTKGAVLEARSHTEFVCLDNGAQVSFAAATDGSSQLTLWGQEYRKESKLCDEITG